MNKTKKRIISIGIMATIPVAGIATAMSIGHKGVQKENIDLLDDVFASSKKANIDYIEWQGSGTQGNAAKSLSEVEYLANKNHYAKGGFIRNIENNQGGVNLEPLMEQIYQAKGLEVFFDLSGETKDKDGKTVVDGTDSAWKDLFIGSYYADYISEGGRNGIKELWYKNNKVKLEDRVNKSSKKADLLKVLKEDANFGPFISSNDELQLPNSTTLLFNALMTFGTAPTQNVLSYVKSGTDWTISSAPAKHGDRRIPLVTDPTQKDMGDGQTSELNLKENTVVVDGTNTAKLFRPGTYNWFPMTDKQVNFYDALKRLGVKATTDIITPEYILGKGIAQQAWGPRVQNESINNNMGMDWILASNSHQNIMSDYHKPELGYVKEDGTFRDKIFGGAKDNNLHDFWPLGFLNPERVKTEMVPMMTKWHKMMLNRGNLLSPWDVGNEPNINIMFAGMIAENPKTFSEMAQGVHETLQEQTKGFEFKTIDYNDESSYTITADPASPGNPRTTFNTASVDWVWKNGVDLPLFVDSHSRLLGDVGFGKWDDPYGKGGEQPRLGLKEYLEQVIGFYPDIVNHVVLSYHTYWDFNPDTIDDVYKFTHDDNHFGTKTMTYSYGVTPSDIGADGKALANPREKEFYNICTELAATDYPNVVGDSISDTGNPDDWNLAEAYFYQLYYHMKEARLSGFLGYRDGTFEQSITGIKPSTDGARTKFYTQTEYDKALADVSVSNLHGDALEKFTDSKLSMMLQEVMQQQVTPFLSSGDRVMYQESFVKSKDDGVLKIFVKGRDGGVKAIMYNNSSHEVDYNLNVGTNLGTARTIVKESLAEKGGSVLSPSIGIEKVDRTKGSFSHDVKVASINNAGDHLQFSVQPWTFYSVEVK